MNYWAIAFPGLLYIASFGACSGSPQTKVKFLAESHRCSDGDCVHLPELTTCQFPVELHNYIQLRHFILYNYRFAQRHPHVYDYCKTYGTPQECPKFYGGASWCQCRQNVHLRYRDVHRVLCPLHCYFFGVRCVVGRQNPRCERLLSNARPDSGSHCVNSSKPFS